MIINAKTIKIIGLSLICVLQALVLVPVCRAESVMAPGMAGGIHSESIKQSIRERTKALRNQRFQKMPYLDRNFVRQVISRKNVSKRVLFEQAGKKTLTDLVDRATQVHTATKTAEERISLAKRRILVAVRNLFPEADFEWENRKGKLSGRAFNNENYRISLRQPLFRGGVLWNTMLQENAALEAAYHEYDSVLSDLVNDVSEAYFSYNRAILTEGDQKELVDKMKRFADISTEKYKEEFISEIEHLNVQSIYSQLKYDYETAKQELEIAKLELQKFMDIDLENDLTIKPVYDVEVLIEKDMANSETSGYDLGDKGTNDFQGSMQVPELKDLVDMAYQHRPELRVESARLEAARLEERIRWGGMLPQADLVFEFGRTGEAFDDNSVDPAKREDFRLQLEFSWNVIGNTVDYTFEHNESAPSVSQFLGGTGSEFSRNNISVGLFDDLQSIADAKEAEVERLEQIQELEETEKEVILDVKQSYYDYQKAKIQVQSTVQRYDYRKRLRNLSEFRLQKNEIEVSEYMQSEIDLLQEKRSLHEALADFYIAKAKLNHAIGVADHFAVEEEYGS